MIRQLPNHEPPNNRGVSRDGYRSAGAMIGLAIGVGLMLTFGLGGVLSSAIFGASGCVMGAIVGEQLHARRTRDS